MASDLVVAWSGGAVDSARNRLLVWGGGHTNYGGNEMYALDLPSLSIKRIIEPSAYTSNTSCQSALPDGTPTSRHTYDGLTYISHADKFFAVHGSLYPCGGGDLATWTYDFAAGKWQIQIPKAPSIVPFGTMAVYDSVSKLVYMKDSGGDFFSYSLEKNTYTQLASNQFVDYHLSATIDTKRRKFVMLGDGVQIIDLNTNTMTKMATTNTPVFVTGQASPGVDYDPVADRIVAWQGGSNVWTLNMDTGVWTQVATGAGPTFAAQQYGTFGRWGYIPQYRVFALVNDIDQNAWVFRLAK